MERPSRSTHRNLRRPPLERAALPSVRRRPRVGGERIAAILAANAGVDLLSCLASLALLALNLQSLLLGRGDGGGLGGLGVGAGLGERLAFSDSGLANRFEFRGAALFAVYKRGVCDSRLRLEFFEQSLLCRGCCFQAVGEFGIF